MVACFRRTLSLLVSLALATLCGCAGSKISSVQAPLNSPPALTFQPALTLYVSPQGNDANPGTITEPFATLARAQDAVRSVKDGVQGDIQVFLREGVYTLSDTWALDQRDSGSNGFRVIWSGYPGENVAISGGVRITGWTQDPQGRWTAPTSLDNFRQLYINGIRALRGRSGPLNSPTLFGDLEQLNGIAGFQSADPEMASWKNPQDVELGFYLYWTHMICGVQNIAGSGPGVSITMRQPCLYLIRHKVGTQAQFPAYVENALELTTSPGQFYLDRSNHKVYYIPRPGENMETAEAIAPSLQTLMSVTGTIDHPALNITFTNITFEHSSWLGASQVGFAELQAAFRVSPDPSRMRIAKSNQVRDLDNEFDKTPGAVILSHAQNVTFERCTFTHIGGSGVDFQLGAQNDTISGGHFQDISASAVQIGDVLADDHHPGDPRMIVRGNRVVNSYIHDIGTEYLGSVAIFAGYTDGTVIAHNEITRTPYTAISVGWGWGMEDPGYSDETTSAPFTTPTPSQNNLIEFNHIHHIMQHNSDGGGIYTLGAMPGTAILSNLIHDNPQPPGGIYLDQGSRGITVANNVVYGVQPAWGQIAPIFLNIAGADRATCSIYGNRVNDPGAAATLAGKAGLEPEYQDLTKPHPAP
jgi:hypothetical protein